LCIVRTCSSTLPCLIDELKPLFGLNKIGTHWIMHKNKMKILTRANISKDGYIKTDYTLNKYKNIDVELKRKIQNVFVFRELLGLDKSTESSIVLKKIKNKIYPLSFYEPDILSCDTVLSKIIVNKWFNDISMDKLIKDMLNIYNIKNITSIIHELRVQFEDIIERVDRNLITYCDVILERISLKLQYVL